MQLRIGGYKKVKTKWAKTLNKQNILELSWTSNNQRSNKGCWLLLGLSYFDLSSMKK